VAKSQLAALMNLRPGTPFTLVLPQRDAAAPKFAMNTEGMVMTAMRNRAELREASYRERINKRELDAALLSALPSFRGIIGVNADSNDFLYNNAWVSYGARASFNLFNVFRLPAQKKVVEANADLIRQRELALTMAVMTQIYVSQARYTHLTAELTTATKQNKVQQAIMYQIRSGHTAGIVSQQTLLREEMNTLVNEVKYDLAYAELQNAYANLYAAMGVDHFSPDVTGRESVASLSQAMASMWAERETALKLD
jgi:outer membrane protein TolC